MPSESPSGTTVTDWQEPPLIDQYLNTWALSPGGQVLIDGAPDPQTRNVKSLAYIARRVWQNSGALWWSKASPIAPWLPPQGTDVNPLLSIPDPRIDALRRALDAVSHQISQSTASLQQMVAADEAATAGLDQQIAAVLSGVVAITGQLASIAVSIDVRLTEVLDAIKALTPKPSIVLDTANATHTLQRTPDRPGP